MTIPQQFARIEALFGRDALERLRKARVMVVGLGGVGGSCVETLARGGVGSLVVIDCDTVEASNLNRQAVAFVDTIGMRKTNAAAALLSRINPDMDIICFDERINAESLDNIFERAGNIDFVVDAIDDVPAKIALAQWTQEHGVPEISCMGTARKIFPERLEFADLFATHDCPLCRSMRSRCHKAGIEHLLVLYSPETPRSCNSEVLGSSSFTPPIAGALLAAHVIRFLLDLNES